MGEEQKKNREISSERRARIRKKRKQEKVILACSALLVAVCLAGVGVLSHTEKNSGESIRSQADQEEQGAQTGETGSGQTDADADQQAKDQTGDGQADGQGGEGQQSGEAETDTEPIEITVSAAGDCTLGTDVNFDQSRSFNAYYNENGAAYFFQSVRSIFDQDDLTIVNMEGTLTESGNRQDKTFAFKGAPEYASVLTEGSVEAANLANNHSRDYGSDSYTDTIRYLEDAGITSFGYDRTALMEISGVKVGLTGIYELAEGMGCEAQMIENLSALEEQGAQIIIVSFHWGTEREHYPDDIQKSLAHSAIDHGADLVLGHHPHVLQGIEKYKGKNIVYSLGNFCFGGNSNPSDKDTMIFQQTFTIQNGELAEDDVTNIIPCSLSSASGYNDYQPTPLEGDEAERIRNRIEEYSSGL